MWLHRMVWVAMMRAIHLSFVAVGILAGCGRPAESSGHDREAARERAVSEIAEANAVLGTMPQIPLEHRHRARCVAIVPSLVRAGLVVGGRHGDGVVSCRTASGWSAPAFISLSGGSAGFQIGIESSDVVVLVMSDRAVTQFFRSNFTVGADVSASAGPAGQVREGATDPEMKAEILSYARSRGLFAGAELSGAVVSQDAGALVAMYGPSHSASSILAGGVKAPPEASALLAHLRATLDAPGYVAARGE